MAATVRELVAELKRANAPRRVVRDGEGLRLEPTPDHGRGQVP
jgi:hypothetical protein